jgi:EAL domain-containing protein (putative c-di-GMP-specific phosphodiesterase class I)
MLDVPADLATVQAIIALGHELGLRLPGEGVESIAQAVQLTALGCEELQGYVFARPLDPVALLAWAGQQHARIERRMPD